MRLTRIQLRDVKAHRDLEIEPAAGLTIVRGPNEAGKSTIQQAIELALFRKADSMARDVLALQRWGAEAPPVVELDFESDGQAGHLTKRFAGQRGEGELSQGDRTTKDGDLIAERLSSLTGIPTEPFFRATASVGHAELAEVAGDEPAISDRLQKAISGADRGTARAKKKLDTAIRRYRSEGQKNPGLLKVAREEVALLETELRAGEESLRSLEADRAAWVEAHEQRVELETQLNRQETDLAEAERALGLVERRAESERRYERLRRATELVEQDRDLRRRTPTDIPLATLRSGAARANSLSLDLSELDAAIGAGADAEDLAEVAGPPPRPMRWLALAAALIVLASAIWLFVGDAIAGVATVLLTVVALVALARSVRLAQRRRQWARDRDTARWAAEEMLESERARQEEYRRKRREFEQQLSALGVADVEAAGALLEAAEAHTAETARIEGELRGLGVEERSLHRLEAERDAAASDAEKTRHALAGMGSLARDPAAARTETERQLARTRPARDTARTEEDQAQGRIDANPIDAELVASLAERSSAARERQVELERRALVYEATLRAIEEAEQATLKTAARYLEEQMGPAIERITEGRYREIEVAEADLDFRVRAPETGELIDVDALSRGTADQLFLTARLGLVRLVTMDRRPPLILDDPFVTFDAARGERALRLVKEVAAEQGFQVLYLTCSDRFDALADELVVLPGPARRDEPVGSAPGDEGANGREGVEAGGTDRSAGVADPFRLGDRSGTEAAS